VTDPPPPPPPPTPWAPPGGPTASAPPRQPPAPMTQPTLPPPAPAVTWPEPSVKLFRVHADTVVIDLPLLPSPGELAWAATMWADPREEHGWARRAWQPGPHGRGFVPATMELGDVVEFGAAAPSARDPRARSRPSGPRPRWYGYVHAVAPEGLLLRGPYPGPGQAHAAAQRALLTWAQAAQQAGVGVEAPHGESAAAIEPAQPPATVTVNFHEQTATIGDPRHGWLTVPADRLAAAMTRPPDELAAMLRPHLPTLCGQEPPITLAALAARHIPGHLRPTTPGSPPPPVRPPPVPAQEMNLP
jgi:hypothetical protein